MSKPVCLCPAQDVREGSVLSAALPDGRKLALYRLGSEVFATDDACTHAAASLSGEGRVVGALVECGRHWGQFDIRTGVARLSPCRTPLRTWPLRVFDGQVWVEVPDA